jgi:hypothetical protein
VAARVPATNGGADDGHATTLTDSGSAPAKSWRDIIKHDAPETERDALEWQCRAGVCALNNPSALYRLRQLSERQLKGLAKHLATEHWGQCEAGRPTFKVRPWTPAEIKMLFKKWNVA